MKSMMIVAAFVLVTCNTYSQDFTGTYSYSTMNGQIMLMLSKNEAGLYTGTLTGNNNTIQLAGNIQSGVLRGKLANANGNIVFSAALNEKGLIFQMADADAFGNINQSTIQTLSFSRVEGQPGAANAVNNDVVINNSVLSKDQIAELVSRYGIAPRPGNYWYDAVSGLYGVVGYPSFGFMYPGHKFGTLARNASSGNTGVMINGRELPQTEWAVWSYVIGYYIQAGSYWFDSNGNVGFAGNPAPVLNLFVIARQNGYAGKGSGGDNFWSSRFSAGNSNSDNSQGYVSVPGYGPVGYGF